MNLTNDTDTAFLTPGGYLATGIYVLIIGVAGTFGNCVVALVITKHCTKLNIYKKAHLPLALSLALSDLGITFFGYPYTSVSGFAGHWVFNDGVCTMAGFFCFFLSMASLDVMVAISIYRYIAICKPGLKIRLNYKTTAWVLCVCWGYAFFWAGIPLLGISKYTYEPFGTGCSMDWASHRMLDVVFLIGTDIFCFLSHLAVLIFCYTKISLVTVVAFVIVWTPYAVVCTWMVFSSDFPKEVTTLPTMFAKSSCVFNPVVYGVFDQHFRQKAKQIVCPWMFRHVVPSENTSRYRSKYPRDESIFCTGESLRCSPTTKCSEEKNPQLTDDGFIVDVPNMLRPRFLEVPSVKMSKAIEGGYDKFTDSVQSESVAGYDNVTDSLQSKQFAGYDNVTYSVQSESVAVYDNVTDSVQSEQFADSETIKSFSTDITQYTTVNEGSVGQPVLLPDTPKHSLILQSKTARWKKYSQSCEEPQASNNQEDRLADVRDGQQHKYANTKIPCSDTFFDIVPNLTSNRQEASVSCPSPDSSTKNKQQVSTE